MFDAARAGNAPLLLQALDAGLPVDLTNGQGASPATHATRRSTCHAGNTLLMLASYAGHTSLAHALLTRNADPNRLNDRGQSIVAGAVFKAHIETVRDLVAAGADPRLGKPSAIETAHMFGRRDLLEVLGAKEGDVGEDVPTPPSALPPSS
jgi:ankyrin repeat protein